jgi:glycosyltransferase involved in cell wall biosynthesis
MRRPREAVYGSTGSVGEFGEHVQMDVAKLEPSEGSRLRTPTAAPRVSIGVPVYNGARFLAATLESLVGQTYEDIEIVISDNGSTDETEQICRDLAARDRRVRYARHDTNRGLAVNYNGLVSETSGPYFKWSAHDDLVAPTFVERCVEVLNGSPERVCLVYPKTQIIDENGDFVRDYDDGLDLRDDAPHDRLRRLVRNLVLCNAQFGLIRRSALERTRLHGSYPSSDYVLLAELALLGEFWEIPEALFFRREHPAMSRLANRTAADVADLFEPGSERDKSGRAEFVREFWRLFGEHLRSINSSPISHAERVWCNTIFVFEWIRRHRAPMWSELFRRQYTWK